METSQAKAGCGLKSNFKRIIEYELVICENC